MTYFSWLLVSAGLALSPFSHAGSGPPPRAMSTTQAAQGWLTTASVRGDTRSVRPSQSPSTPQTTAMHVTTRPTTVRSWWAAAPANGAHPATVASAVRQMVSDINAARARYGLPADQVNPTLTRIAQARAEALVADGVFTSNLPGLGLPLTLEQAAGLHATGMGAENIAEAATVAQAFQLLMASPAHRSNILNPYETQVGVGIAALPNGVAVSQLFMGP